MIRFKHLLLATDFSPCSVAAADHALALATALHAEVTLLHVVELPPGLDPTAAVHPERDGPTLPLAEYVTQADRATLEDLAAGFRAAGLKTTTAVAIGPIPATIAARAQSLRSDLLIVGTHGRTGLRRVLLGSVAERLLRLSPVPVLVIRRDGEDQIAEEDRQARVEAEG